MATDKAVLAVIRSSRPTFRNLHDRVAFAVHGFFLASGYKLIATGSNAAVDSPFSSASGEEVPIDGWNELGQEEYAFVYADDEDASKKLLLKCLVMNDVLVIDALFSGCSEPAHLEVKVSDYAEESDAPAHFKFKRLDKLTQDLDRQILSKGSSRIASSSSSRGSEARDEEGHGVSDFCAGEDEGSPTGCCVIPPFSGSDLLPGPGVGIFGGEGSMLVGPRDPRWFGGRTNHSDSGINPWVPPGARFDPYGPPDVPGFEPNRFVRFPGRRPARGGGIHPDLHHFGGFI